jgi:hypothetical protein
MLVASPFGPFCFSRWPGFFVGRSHRTTFLLVYLESNWSKVGSTLTSRPCVLFPCVSFLSLCGRWRLWPWVDCLAESARPSVWAPDRPHVGVRPSAMLGSGCRARLLNWVCPPAPPDLLVFLFRAFRAIFLWYIWRARIANDDIFAFAFIGHFEPNRDLFACGFYCIDRKWSCVHLHILKSQPTLIYGRLYLSTKKITIIGGMGKNYATYNKHVSLIHP